MEVREGYKKTEIGVIPEDWEVKKLGEVADIVTGNTPPTNDATNYGFDYFFVSPADLGKGKWILDTEKKLSKKGFTISRKFPRNSILFTCIGSTIGKSSIAPKELTSNQQINAILPNDSYDTDYLFYCLTLLSHKIKAKASEQAVPIINKSEFGETSVPLPPLPEQKAIAEVLSDTDNLIQTLKKRIVKKRQIKQGTMQKLLTPKEDWEIKKLGKIAEITGAGVDKKINSNEVSVILLNYLDVYKRDYIYKNELNHQVTAPINKTLSCNVKEGDIFLTPSSELRIDIGISAIAMEDLKGVVYSYHINRLRYKITMNKLFGLYMLKTRKFLAEAETICEGSGKRYVISLRKFREMEICYPKSIEEQNRIATILSDMDKEIEALEKKLSKYKLLKQGLMQNLLTGKMRLI